MWEAGCKLEDNITTKLRETECAHEAHFWKQGSVAVTHLVT